MTKLTLHSTSQYAASRYPAGLVYYGVLLPPLVLCILGQLAQWTNDHTEEYLAVAFPSDSILTHQTYERNEC